MRHTLGHLRGRLMLLESPVKATVELQGFRVHGGHGGRGRIGGRAGPRPAVLASLWPVRGAWPVPRHVGGLGAFGIVPLWGIAVALRYAPRRVRMHSPHHAPDSHIDRYRGRFDMGWDDARVQILARQIELGVVPADTQLTDRIDEIPAWDSRSDDEQRLYAPRPSKASAATCGNRISMSSRSVPARRC